MDYIRRIVKYILCCDNGRNGTVWKNYYWQVVLDEGRIGTIRIVYCTFSTLFRFCLFFYSRVRLFLLQQRSSHGQLRFNHLTWKWAKMVFWTHLPWSVGGKRQYIGIQLVQFWPEFFHDFVLFFLFRIFINVKRVLKWKGKRIHRTWSIRPRRERYYVNIPPSRLSWDTISASFS